MWRSEERATFYISLSALASTKHFTVSVCPTFYVPEAEDIDKILKRIGMQWQKY